MTAKEEQENIPHLGLVDDSEIIAEIDLSAIGLDEIFRPIFISNSEGDADIALSLQDAKRLYDWLEGAIIYLEERMQ